MPGIMPGPMFDPLRFVPEFLYAAIILFTCLFVYFKTREMFELSRYRGIQHFRNAFLFFGLAYASRFVFVLFQLSLITLDYRFPRRLFFPFSGVLVAYFSTMALFYLAYSVGWKGLDYKKFLAWSNVIAVGIAVIAFVTRSPHLIWLVQLPILGFALYSARKAKHRVLYFLIGLFWLLSLFSIGGGFRVPPEFGIVLDLLSVAVFGYLAYKVSKWTK